MQSSSVQTALIQSKKLWYLKRGEPIEYGAHKLRYVPGSRPIRLKYIDSTDAVTRNDAKQIKFVLEKVRPGSFVLDIGGNVGQYAILFGAVTGSSGKVISFEPDPDHRRVLEKNIVLNGFSDTVHAEGLAVSDQNGSHILFSRKNDQMSSLVRSGLGTNAHSPEVREQTISMVRLDDYLARNKLDFPDWVKIDTEGAEVNVLRGARNLLKSKATMLCELHPYAWAEFGTSFDEFLTIIRECRRTVRYLDESYKIEDGPVHGSVLIQ